MAKSGFSKTLSLSRGKSLTPPLGSSDLNPSYNPDEFDIEDNFNVLQISEIHSFEPEYRKEEYKQNVGKQIDQYVKKYDVDRVSILRDTGPLKDVEDILGEVETEVEIWIVAGDEDKVDPKEDPLNEKDWLGWFEAANSSNPFNIENEYRIFDEGYETEIQGRTVQAAHHPCDSKRAEKISFPDPRYTEEVKEPETPEEMYKLKNRESFFDRLFSANRDSNENTESQVFSENNVADIMIYDHVHMPYIRSIFETAVIGLGGRNHNYQIKADSLPLRSLHLNSHGENLVHSMHFDADRDQIFEHQIFDFSSEDLRFYDVQLDSETGVPYKVGYKPIQSRFVKGQYREKAKEAEQDLPKLWSKRN